MTVSGLVEPPNWPRVVKAAAKTQRTRGWLTAIDVNAVFMTPDYRLLEARGLSEVVAEEGLMAAPGDSGATVLIEPDDPKIRERQALGLIVAGTAYGQILGGKAIPGTPNLAGRGVAYVLPLKFVLDALNVELM